MQTKELWFITTIPVSWRVSCLLRNTRELSQSARLRVEIHTDCYVNHMIRSISIIQFTLKFQSVVPVR